MTEKQRDLCIYRFEKAEETIRSSKLCMDNKFFKDSINRSYYAAFYAVKAVLALEDLDFKRHKDVIAYFNQHFVVTEIFDREVGRKLARLQKKREASDYDDFFVASMDEADEQLGVASFIVGTIRKYLVEKAVWQGNDVGEIKSI